VLSAALSQLQLQKHLMIQAVLNLWMVGGDNFGEFQNQRQLM